MGHKEDTLSQTTTKANLIEMVASRCDLSVAHSKQVVDLIFDEFSEALRAGDKIEIRGFGSFTLRRYKSYQGRNPKTGQSVNVSPKRLPFFRAGKNLLLRMNR